MTSPDKTEKKDDKKSLEAGKKLDPNLLEEDDEFEEFPAEDWAGKEGGEEDEDDINVWEDNWDDQSVEDDFSKQLRAELEKHGHKTATS